MKSDAAAEFRKKLETLTQKEILNLAEKMHMEIQELRCQCECYERRHKSQVQDTERERLLGLIEGLKYSIRCNGISGGDIQGI